MSSSSRISWMKAKECEKCETIIDTFATLSRMAISFLKRNNTKVEAKFRSITGTRGAPFKATV